MYGSVVNLCILAVTVPFVLGQISENETDTVNIKKNETDTVKKKTLKIVIEEPNQQPTYYAFQGRNFTIKCVVYNAGAGSQVLWYKNGARIASTTSTGFDTRSSITWNNTLISTLTKRRVSAEDDATYKCVETNSRMSYGIEVRVSQIIGKDAVVHRPTNSCLIECEVQGALNDGDYTTTWHKGDVKIEDKEKKYKNHENGSLEILSVDFSEDLGEYSCVIWTGDTQTANQTVIVYGQAYVHQFDKSKNLVEDDALNLTCKAYGYPTPVVSWFRDGAALNSTQGRMTFAPYNNVANASVKITKMQFEDAGTYSCEAINDINGQLYNSTASINVRVKDKLAALWPFLGICVEVTILCIIIFIYERHRQKKLEEEDAKEEAGHLTNSHSTRDDVRQRKV